MQQAESTNIIKMPSRIELLFKRYEAAAREKARIYAIFDQANDVGPEAEAATDAVYDALENIAGEILATKATSKTDFAIQARVLAPHRTVEDVYYRPEDILQFFDDLQTFAAR
jgi:hypothetical protein